MDWGAKLPQAGGAVALEEEELKDMRLLLLLLLLCLHSTKISSTFGHESRISAVKASMILKMHSI